MVCYDFSAYRIPKSLLESIDPEIEPLKYGAILSDSLFIPEELCTEFRRSVLTQEPLIAIDNAFDISALPTTPTEFKPLESKSLWSIGNSVNAILHKVGLRPCSYHSENQGHLHVNLVANPESKKSQGGMRGHTDGSGHRQPQEQVAGESPSPDYVVLSVLRNPQLTPTMVASLSDVLELLSPSAIEELKLPQFIAYPQGTFDMKRVLINVPILFMKPLAIRFSHSKILVSPNSINSRAANSAIKELSEAISVCAKPVVGKPGSIYLINNRVAIHGRKPPGNMVEGNSRWLIRTYGISQDIETISEPETPHILIP